MSVPVWLIPIGERLIERLWEAYVRGEAPSMITLDELLDEVGRNRLTREAALEAARRRIEERESKR